MSGYSNNAIGLRRFFLSASEERVLSDAAVCKQRTQPQCDGKPLCCMNALVEP